MHPFVSTSKQSCVVIVVPVKWSLIQIMDAAVVTEHANKNRSVCTMECEKFSIEDTDIRIFLKWFSFMVNMA